MTASHLEEGFKIESNHSHSSELFFEDRYPTYNHRDYDDAFHIGGFGNENDDTIYKPEEKQ
jgi:hypothetical protein